MATEPKVPKVRHAANAAHLIHQENAQHGAKNVSSVETRNHFSTCCRTRDRKKSLDRDQHRLTHRESWSKRRSRSRHKRYASEDSEDRSRSRSTTQSANSIEWHSFQVHCELHERLPNDLHERHPFENNDSGTKTFHSISRLKSVASISNEMDPDGKTKIVTILNIKLPHQNGIDNVRVKVDNGADAIILPLDSFRTMFPHALDNYSYPQDRILRRPRTQLECYNNGKLINHGSIKLRLQHYSDESLQDHSFYVVETKTCKEIIVWHAACSRLDFVQVLCKNVSKSVSAIENKTNISSKDSFQDLCLK